MSDIPFWSPTASLNQDAAPDGWPETSMLIGQVNNSARENMAAVRRQWNDAQWFNYGDGDKTPSYSFVSSAVVRVVGGAGAIAEYHMGRRVKYVGAATIYGTIQSSVINAADLDVTVTWDSGNAINENFTLLLSILRADNSNVPEGVTVNITNLGDHAGKVLAPDGTETEPSVTNEGDTDTGRWYPGANTIAESTGGVERERLDNTQKTFSVPVEVPDGTEAAPSIHGADVDTGVYWSAAATRFASGGSEALRVSGSGITTFNNRVSGERSSTTFATGQTLTLSTVLTDDASYLLTAQESIAGNSGNPGVYLVYRRGTDDNISPIVSAPGLNVIINGLDQVAIQNVSGQNRTIIAALLRLT